MHHNEVFSLNSELLTVERTESDGVHHIKLSGELDMSNTDKIESALDGFTHGQRVVVDTTDLDFIDSSGLRVLVNARSELGDQFELVAGRVTDRLLDVAGVREHFEPR